MINHTTKLTKAKMDRLFLILSSQIASEDVSDVIIDITNTTDGIRALIQCGLSKEALPIAESLTDNWISVWPAIKNLDILHVDMSYFFEDLNELWLEIFLTLDLQPDETKYWVSKIKNWTTSSKGYDITPPFPTVKATVGRIWREENFVAVMKGANTKNIVTKTLDDAVINAVIRVLILQDRQEELICITKFYDKGFVLAKALVRLDRVQEGIDSLIKYLERELPDSSREYLFFCFGNTLIRYGKPEEVIKLFSYALDTLPFNQQGVIASKLKDLTRESGQQEIALKARISLLRSRPEKSGYHFVKERLGHKWMEIRKDFFNYWDEDMASATIPVVVQGGVPRIIEILIEEEEIDREIALLSKLSTYGQQEPIRKIFSVATEAHADWILSTVKIQVDLALNQIQNCNGASYSGIRWWLERANAVLAKTNQAQEWYTYLESLSNEHEKKRSLIRIIRTFLLV